MVNQQEMISPFERKVVRNEVLEYGLGDFGYGFRLSDTFHVPTPMPLVDPKRRSTQMMSQIRRSQYQLSPHEFVIGHSLEYFKLPDSASGWLCQHPEYVRCGVLIIAPAVLPGFAGHLSFTIINHGNSRVTLHAFEGIGQLAFLGASSDQVWSVVDTTASPRLIEAADGD